MLASAGCTAEPVPPTGVRPAGSEEVGANAGGASGSSGSSPLDGGAGGASDAASIPSSGCGAVAPSGNVDWTVKSGGRDRTVRVHLPPGYDGKKPTPVVLAFHGRNTTAAMQELASAMTPKADAAGFIVAYPTGVGLTWNAGLCCGQAQSENVDDVAFTSAMLDAMESKLCVDKQRVFATGLSNGAFMANRVACELADRFAAIAPVAGQLMTLSCAASRPVAVMHFHGTADTIVPYGGMFGLPGVEASVAAWAQRNGCKAAPAQTFAAGDTTCKTFGQCTAGADVTLCTVDGGGHQWPGGFAIPGLGKTTTDINATDAMWSFFEKHPKP